MKRPLYIFVLIIGSCIGARSQISVAVGDFENLTGHLYLDSWARNVPEYLSTEMSRYPDVAVVDRRRMRTLLDEQKLQSTGLMDSSRVIEIGRLLSAEYIVTGSISETGGWIRIDARVTSVSSGRMVSEAAAARTSGHLENMIAMLANNLRVQMTGRGEYRESMILRKYPTKYFLGGTLLAGAVTSVLHSGYRLRRNEYQKTTRLEDFDSKYDSANRWYRARSVAVSMTAAALLGTLYCWLGDLSPDRIQANHQSVHPALGVQMGELTVGLRIEF
jgi:TolB-like protein